MPPLVDRVDDIDIDGAGLELGGLDALQLEDEGPSRWRRLWASAWPKLGAIVIALSLWQAVVWSHWKREDILPGPLAVLRALSHGVADGTLPRAIGITMQRAVIGFAIATVIGVVVGTLIARWRVLRLAFGSFVTGVQTMPSVAWFPLALLLFKRSEGAILFVVVLGAAPAIANGVIAGTDHVPPLLVRAGRVLGARGFGLYRTVVLPASWPAVLAGFKQGWAFAWRSLMAGELLVVILGKASIGVQMQNARELADTPALMASMVVILVLGILIDSLVFNQADKAIRRRRGLIERPG
jgi:NitT/TauT family transport system permease protein